MLTPDKINEKQFQSSGRGSYRAEDVDAFINEVSASYEQMFKENGDLVRKISILAKKVGQRSFGIQLSEIRNILRASRAALFRAIHAQGVAAEYAGARRQLSVLRVLGLAFFRIDIAHHSHVVLYRNRSREA